MGSDGYRLVDDLQQPGGMVLLEVGAGESTRYLTRRGRLYSIDVQADRIPAPAIESAWVDDTSCGCRPLVGRAEEILTQWHRVAAGAKIAFAWLDGHDWPYDDLPPAMRDQQAREYHDMGLDYSKEASRASHKTVAQLVMPWVLVGGVIAFDDTWQTPDGGFDGKGGSAVPWLLAAEVRAGHQFELWRVQADRNPWHDGYVAVRRVR